MRLRRGNPREPVNDWPAFTDLLGAFVLVIFLALVFFLINFRTAESKLNDREQKLRVLDLAVRKKTRELARDRKKLRQERAANQRLLDDLRRTEQNLQKAKGAKKVLSAMLDKLKQERAAIEKAREKAEKALEDAKSKLASAKTSLGKAVQEREKCQQKIQRYIGVRKRIIERIFTRLRREVKDPSLVQFDKKGGSIKLGARVLFKAGSRQLQNSGKKNLLTVWKGIHETLKDPLNRAYIGGIVVEGYTSREGKERYNWRLSSQRALAALQYLRKHGGNYWSQRGLISAAGYGPTRIIYDNKGRENAAASRRIELRILFRDREQLEKLVQKLKSP
jgi:outer membrane protein OmpA-like peptidoglycan-associated protein